MDPVSPRRGLTLALIATLVASPLSILATRPPAALAMTGNPLPVQPAVYATAPPQEAVTAAEVVAVIVTPTPTPVPTLAHPVRPWVAIVATPRPTAVPIQVTGTKTDWMAAAGIPQSDWPSVDFIIQKESGWRPNAINPSSGACGLAQFLPCSPAKAGADWDDPVNALRRADAYARSRYQSWSGAVSWWQSHRWW